MLLLHGPKTFFLLTLLLKKTLFNQLLVALVHNGGLLFGIEALEMVGLHSVWREYGLFSGGVLSHEIMCVSVVELGRFLLRPV